MKQDVDGLIEAAEERWRVAWHEGPTRLRWATLPPQVGDRAPDATLLDHRSHPTRLSSGWSDGPLLLLFWRHFGCSCGMDRAARLRSELADYRAAGGDVVIVAHRYGWCEDYPDPRVHIAVLRKAAGGL